MAHERVRGRPGERSKAQPIRFYGDPLDNLIAAEAATCKGCAHVGHVFDVAYCTKGKKHGRRCKHYEERPGAGKAA